LRDMSLVRDPLSAADTAMLANTAKADG